MNDVIIRDAQLKDAARLLDWETAVWRLFRLKALPEDQTPAVCINGIPRQKNVLQFC